MTAKGDAAFKRELYLRGRLRNDFDFFAKKELTIRTKHEGLQRFKLNRAQKFLHDRIEQQLKEFGRVRVLVLKGRQQGVSTYVGARFFWKVIHHQGKRAFVMAHTDDSTSHLFEIVKRYNEGIARFIRPSMGSATSRSIYYDKLSSGYQVGTAGSAGVGRGSTIQLLHGSEVAFWNNAESHITGVLQAVPDAGSEVILESTANGLGNYFHDAWTRAEVGLTDYEPIFIPWYWQPEYAAMHVPSSVTFTKDERHLAEVFNLSEKQLLWRRRKIQSLQGSEEAFAQEYPNTASEAFQNTGHTAFLNKNTVLMCRRNEEEPIGPLVIGVDPAGDGDDADRSAICWRVGRKVLKVETFIGLDTMALAGHVKVIIDRDTPARVFIDAVGLGKGVFDRLREMGSPYSRVVRAVNAQGKPFHPPGKDEVGPVNRRAEMWMAMKAWLEDPDMPSDIPNDDALQGDLLAPGFRYTSNGLLQLEGKRDMRARGQKSPDLADAMALTFAEPVGGSDWQDAYPSKPEYGRAWWKKPEKPSIPSPWCA